MEEELVVEEFYYWKFWWLWWEEIIILIQAVVDLEVRVLLEAVEYHVLLGVASIIIMEMVAVAGRMGSSGQVGGSSTSNQTTCTDGGRGGNGYNIV
jgi:hypothetical protein